MVGALISVLVVVGIFLLVFMLVRRIFGLALSLGVGLFFVVVVIGTYVYINDGTMPVVLDNLLRSLGNVITAVLSVLSDIFYVGAEVTKN